jgi:hypothetical protein
VGVGSYVEVAAGVLVTLVALYDLFQSVVVPRPAVSKIRLSAPMVRVLWSVWRRVGIRNADVLRREAFLGSFAPFALIAMLVVWVLALVFGYGLIVGGLSDELKPRPGNFLTAVYFSGTSMLTVGYGDIVPVGNLARAVALIEAANGLGVVALVISLLFSLYGSFQRREVLVVTLDAMAGAPPSAVNLLEKVRKLDMMPYLDRTFDDWRMWCADVLESHLAYPILNYFRSSHDNESWLSSLGTVLDAATLVITTIEDVPRGPAQILYRVGNHLVEDLAQIMSFELDHVTGIERFEFDQACERLIVAGYRLGPADAAWEKFADMRAAYAGPLNSMAVYWAIPPAQWISDRSYMPHRVRETVGRY